MTVPADVSAVVTARANRTGQVLSSDNAAALRKAHVAAGQLQAHIESVLSSAGIEPDAADEIEDPVEGDRARRQREAQALALAYAPGELDALEARDDELRAPYDYEVRQRCLARLEKAAK